MQCRRPEFNPWVRQIPWKRKWQPTPVFLPGKSHGQRSLADCSPWGCKESDTTECLMDGWTTHFTSYVTSGRSFTSPPYASISLSLRKGGGQDQLHHLTKGLTPTVLCLFTTLCSVVAEQRPCINCPISHIEAELGV